MYVCGGAGGGGQRDYFFAYLSILYLNFAVFFLILLSYLLTSAHSRNDSLYVLLIIIQAKLVKKFKFKKTRTLRERVCFFDVFGEK